MTTASILNIIKRLNKNPNTKEVIKYSISPSVEFAHIWIKEKYNSNIPYNFFLIKNELEYVGAVLDMTQDLHWVILPKYRGKGYLTKALKGSILLYIFEYLDRAEQKISINIDEIGIKNYNASNNTAINVGFSKLDDNNFIINYDVIDYSLSDLNLIHNGLDDKEVEKQLKELELAAKKIFQINSKIEMSYGIKTETYLKPSLDEISRKISYFKTVIEDIQHDYIMNKD